MFWTVRNLPFDLVQLVTLTYGRRWSSLPEVRARHWGRFADGLRRRGVQAFAKVEWQARGAPHITVWLSRSLPKVELQAMWLGALGDYAERGYHEDQRVHVLPWFGGREHAAVYAAGYAKKSGAKAYQDEPPGFLGEVLDVRGVRHYRGPVGVASRSTGRLWSVVRCEVRAEEFEDVQPVTVRTIHRARVSKARAWRRPRKLRDNGVSGFRAYDCSAIARALLRGHGGGWPTGGVPSGVPGGRRRRDVRGAAEWRTVAVRCRGSGEPGG
jgi:hypothetical protein